MISSLPKWFSNFLEDAMLPNAKVLEISHITPYIKKIRFQVDISKWNFQIGYANVVRVSETKFRNYTIASYDKQKGLCDIIFHLHGNGIGSKYINDLKQDDSIYISRPRGKKIYDSAVKQQLFFGDETSLGVATALFRLFKKNNHQFHFYFELDEANKYAPELLGLENFSICPKKLSFQNDKWIINLPICQTDKWHKSNLIFIGNAKSVRSLRKILMTKIPGTTYSQGYWLEGKKGL